MKKVKRNLKINFKLTPAERSAAERLAEAEGRTLSEAAREALRLACERRGVLVINGHQETFGRSETDHQKAQLN